MFCNICLDINKKKGGKNILFLLDIIVCFSYILAGLLTFIPSLREKAKNTINDALIYKKNSNSSIELVYKKNYLANKGKSKIVIFYIFLISILICNNYFLIHFSTSKHLIEQRLYLFFFIIIFSKIILKQYIHKHQVFSLSISFIGFVFISIFSLLKFEKSDILGNIYYLISKLGLALNFVLIKHLVDNYYVSPFDCLLYVGIETLILTIIVNIVYSKICYKDFSIIINIFDFPEKIIYFYLFLLIILAIIYQILTILIIYYFSPILLMVSDIISPMLYFIYEIFINKEKIEEPKMLNIIFHYIGYFIILICSLIYNEIIICNFCDLNKYTSKYIIERQKQELASLKNNEKIFEENEKED